MARHPRGSCIVLPLLSLEVAIPEIELTHLKLSSICKSASQAVLSRMCYGVPSCEGIPREMKGGRCWEVFSSWVPVFLLSLLWLAA